MKSAEKDEKCFLNPERVDQKVEQWYAVQVSDTTMMP